MVKVVLAGVFLVLFVLFATYAARQGEKLAARKRGRLASARPAEARVLAAKNGNGGVRKNGRHGVELLLTLDVDGRTVEERWDVYELGLTRVQPGGRIPVRVDAEDPAVVYPDAGDDGWAETSTTRWIEVLKV